MQDKQGVDDTWFFATDEMSERARREHQWIKSEGVFIEQRISELDAPSQLYLHLTLAPVTQRYIRPLSSSVTEKLDLPDWAHRNRFLYHTAHWPREKVLRHCFDSYLTHLARRTGGKVYHFSSMQAGDLNGRFHVHSIILGAATLTPALALNAWRAGRAEAERYELGCGGSQYLMRLYPTGESEVFDNLPRPEGSPATGRGRRRGSRHHGKMRY